MSQKENPVMKIEGFSGEEPRRADKDGLFQTEADLIFQRDAIKLFMERLNKPQYCAVEPTDEEGNVDLTHPIDAIVAVNEPFMDDMPVGLIEAKARPRFRWEEQSHKAQIGLDKLSDAYTYYNRGWEKSITGKVTPIIYLVGVHPKKEDGTTDTSAPMEVYGINLSVISEWLLPRLRAFKADPKANHNVYGDMNIRLITNKHQIPHKQHYCLNIPMEWFVKIDENFTGLDANIKKLGRWTRERNINEKYHDQKDEFGEYAEMEVEDDPSEEQEQEVE